MSNNLTVVNALKSCKGLITRIRNRQGQIQKSVIDFFVVCKRLLPHVTEMIVDENREMTITNYHCAKRGKSAVDSDHVTFMLKINLNVLPHKPQRVERLDFKNTEGKILFKKKTTETSEFTDCFKNMLPLLDNCERWNDTLKAHCKSDCDISCGSVEKLFFKDSPKDDHTVLRGEAPKDSVSIQGIS